MKIKGWHRISSWIKRVGSLIKPCAAILFYHRIAEPESDPFQLSVSPHNFTQHLEVIKRHYQVIHLKDLKEKIRLKQLNRRFVIITFDDGYADNFHNAKPVLEEYGIPATVFVASGFIGQSCEFWWDDLERIFLQPGILPETLSLNIGNRQYEWKLGKSSNYKESDYQNNRSWIVGINEPTERHIIFQELHSLIRPLTPGERQNILTTLHQWAGIKSEGRLTHRVLTDKELLSLSEGYLIEIGAHTIIHPVLSALPLSSQEQEIQNGKIQLEKIIGKPINSFSYPYGASSDYTTETVKIAQKSGFTCACTTLAGIARKKSDYFQLPRFPVRNWSKEKFAHTLQKWFDE